MLRVAVYLDKSTIEGIGVFAKAAIARGTTVWRFDPELDRLVSHATYEAQDAVVRDYLDRYAYPRRGQDGVYVFEADDARYMNHSDAPNVDVSPGDHAVAVMDIAAGEEITCDYNAFFEAGFEFLGTR